MYNTSSLPFPSRLSPPGALHHRLCGEADISRSLRKNGETARICMKLAGVTIQGCTSFPTVQTRGGLLKYYVFCHRRKKGSKLIRYQLVSLFSLSACDTYTFLPPHHTIAHHLPSHSGAICRCCAWFSTWPASSRLPTAATGWRESALTARVATFQVSPLKGRAFEEHRRKWLTREVALNSVPE